ncbi:MFS transporter [Solicola sp. PLA-1-18]|uniref:MFS transporter n=1 Tax=Solicola sp. PLA-1-18 TaxID=3380532 RepID=UPI003B75E544
MTSAGVLWTPGFRRLLAARLTSQAGDGAFTAGVAFLVLLSPTSQQTPTAYAGVLALLLLPFCVVGPFAASVIDRWRRRRVLVLGQMSRVALAAVVAVLALTGDSGPWTYVLVLLALGVNRLVLAALSASVPHVVGADRFVDANALGPTSGSVTTGIGIGVGGAVAAATQTAGAVLVAVALWSLAALVARGFGRDELGPDVPLPTPTLRATARDLAAVTRHLRDRPRASVALARLGAARLLVGALTIATLAVTGTDGTEAAVVALASGIGFGAGAVGTPWASRRVRTGTWVAGCLVVAVVLGAVGATLAVPWSWATAGLGVGLLAQSTKIWTDTLVQRHVDEPFLGRAFTVYDLVYNASFVLGTLVVLPLV